MPKRTDIKSILIIGAGPIVIGQACEFDYSGTQACKALKEEGYRIVLVNSNPATIMTDPDLADATYIEPITPEIVARIIEKERPDALLPTMGGQTALNCALSLKRMGVLDKFGVQMIGANAEAIDKAEDRELFREAMHKIGLETPRSALANASVLKHADRETHAAGIAAIKAKKLPPDEEKKALHAFEVAWAAGEADRKKKYIEPRIDRGAGGAARYRPARRSSGRPSRSPAPAAASPITREEFLDIIERGLDASPTNEVLIEESVLGWKEFEMEVVRDKADNCIIICSIENIDPMGVHTGDSITVAPALTLTDKEYQIMRDASLAVLREIGVETGGSNVQFAVNPADWPAGCHRNESARVALFSAWPRKPPAFRSPRSRPSSRSAIRSTRSPTTSPAARHPLRSSRPSITSSPRSRALPSRNSRAPRNVLTTSMKSVGEAMAIGRNFQESLQKALRSLETGLTGLDDIAIEGVGRRRRQECDPRCPRHADARPHPQSRAGDAARHGRRTDP